MPKYPFIFLGLAVSAVFATASHGQSVALGEAYVQRNCASCHSVTPNVAPGAGPGLFGVVGRKAGSAANFHYSDALNKAHAAGMVWTTGNLDAFLSDPGKRLPGTVMPVKISAKADRTHVIAYLASLKGKQAAETKPAAAPAKPAANLPASEVWRDDSPGKVHHIVFADLPAPFAVSSAGNPPQLKARPKGAMPAVPAGFTISLFATDPGHGRLLLTAPNGDVFISEAGSGEIKIIHADKGATTGVLTVFTGGLDQPYGMAFYPSGADPQYLYVANINSVVRIPYRNGDLKARGAPETLVRSLTSTSGAHTTRSLAFSPDGKHMFVAIGSATNVANTMAKKPPQPVAAWEGAHGLGAAWGDENGRAMVAMFDPDGKNRQTYATGLRNCVGLVVYPATGELMCSVNERDELGDNLPPDYVTRVAKGGYYGWPWYYIGGHEDPRLAGLRPDLKDKVTTPDLLLQPHSAPLGMTVYQPRDGAAHAFPKAYDGDIFVALHGSWNAARRTGSKVVRVIMKDGKPTGAYEDFMTGLVLSDSAVWGRPSSVAVAADGALLVDDDATGLIWRIAPVG